MTPRYMLDTNICIYLMKQQPSGVAARFAQCYVGEVVISAITLAELEFGIICSGEHKPQNRQALDQLLEDIHVTAFDARSAAAYGPIRLATKDKKRDALDKLIAAHAVASGVVLVTNNESDFVNYPDLKIENWVASH